MGAIAAAVGEDGEGVLPVVGFGPQPCLGFGCAQPAGEVPGGDTAHGEIEVALDEDPIVEKVRHGPGLHVEVESFDNDQLGVAADLDLVWGRILAGVIPAGEGAGAGFPQAGDVPAKGGGVKRVRRAAPAESFGVEDRGSFYDAVGTLKDVVQNHLMQILALLAMDPPVTAGAEALHDEQIRVFRAIKPLTPQSFVRGQYRGYLDVPGVKKDSTTETFCALRLEIDSWRWAGVPFLIRAGKALAHKATEAVVELNQPPRLLFADPKTPQPATNRLRFRLGQDPGVTLTVQAKRPGEGMVSEPVDLNVDFGRALGPLPLPYERLLGDALAGDNTMFASEAFVEHTWTILDPLLRDPGPVHVYEPGTMGPKEADRLVEGACCSGWIEPVAPPSDRSA